LASLGHPCKFQRVSRLGSVTACNSSSARQPNSAALNRGRHLYPAGRRSRWALAHISSLRLFYGDVSRFTLSSIKLGRVELNNQILIKFNSFRDNVVFLCGDSRIKTETEHTGTTRDLLLQYTAARNLRLHIPNGVRKVTFSESHAIDVYRRTRPEPLRPRRLVSSLSDATLSNRDSAPAVAIYTAGRIGVDKVNGALTLATHADVAPNTRGRSSSYA